MYSLQDNKAIGLSLETLRPIQIIKAMRLAIRSSTNQHSLQANELRRVQGKRVPLELPTRRQNTDLVSL